MAYIAAMKQQSIQRPKKHNPTEATYDVVIVNGEKFLQIATYGSSTREIPGKASQVIQFDTQSLAQLKRIIEDYF
ncbi:MULTISPECIES: hypothetical protein [Bacteria]|uniref:hypothetical protein n=1 Tax=Bacteria TaxID=2 RepID=UPI001C02ED64|nr:hypothetical protein [Desulfovibrio desulfuricans]